MKNLDPRLPVLTASAPNSGNFNVCQQQLYMPSLLQKQLLMLSSSLPPASPLSSPAEHLKKTRNESKSHRVIGPFLPNNLQLPQHFENNLENYSPTSKANLIVNNNTNNNNNINKQTKNKTRKHINVTNISINNNFNINNDKADECNTQTALSLQKSLFSQTSQKLVEQSSTKKQPKTDVTFNKNSQHQHQQQHQQHQQQHRQRQQTQRRSNSAKNCIRLEGLPPETCINDIVNFLDSHSHHIKEKGVHLVYNNDVSPSETQLKFILSRTPPCVLLLL